jgi:hypothetical protein
MKILHLTLKKKWFDMIASGEKKEEYRVMKTYWCTRLNPLPPFKEFDVIEFRNGYAKDAPKLTVKFEGIQIGAAKPEWSDNWQGDVFKIKLGEIIA